MKINTTDLAKMQTALDAVNGRASTHCFTAQEVFKLAGAAEKRARKQLSNKMMCGMRAALCSMPALPGSYKGSVLYNRVTIQRCATGWFVTGVERRSSWPCRVPTVRMQPTAVQVGYIRAAMMQRWVDFDA